MLPRSPGILVRARAAGAPEMGSRLHSQIHRKWREINRRSIILREKLRIDICFRGKLSIFSVNHDRADALSAKGILEIN